MLIGSSADLSHDVVCKLSTGITGKAQACGEQLCSPAA